MRGWLVALALLGGTAAGEETGTVAAEVRPGWVSFDVDHVVGGRAAKVDLNLDRAALAVTQAALAPDGPSQMQLHSLRLRVFEISAADASVQARVDRRIEALAESGWSALLRVPEAHAAVLLRAEGERIHGLVLLAAPGNRVMFGNLVCDTEARAFGATASRWFKEGPGREWLTRLAAVLGGRRAPAAATPSPLPASRLVPDGFTARLEAETMAMTWARVVDLPDAGGGQAVWFDDPGSAVRGSVRLPAGAYEARLFLRPTDLEHDAVHFAVNGQAAQRVYRPVPGLGPAEKRTLFRLDAPADVAVEVRAAEVGVAVDAVEFLRLTPAPEAGRP